MKAWPIGEARTDRKGKAGSAHVKRIQIAQENTLNIVQYYGLQLR